LVTYEHGIGSNREYQLEGPVTGVCVQHGVACILEQDIERARSQLRVTNEQHHVRMPRLS
jgi:hypothetical protein